MTRSPHCNIASYLPDMAASRPSAPAVIFPEGRDTAGRVAYTLLTFRQLNDESDRRARAFYRLGIRKGTRTVLMVSPSLDFFVLTFALFKLGAVPVLIDPGMGLKNLKTCLGEADPRAFIGIPKAHLARILLRWPKVAVLITVGGPRLWGGHDLAKLESDDATAPLLETTAEDMAAILFTSGSTGIPKGAVYTHGIFTAQVRALQNIYGIEPGEVDLATFPLFALFGPALGMTAIIPDMDATRPALVSPVHIFEAIENFGVTNMFGSPALLNRVGRHGAAQGIRLPTLKRVISAGAPVPAAVLDTFSQMLDEDAEIFTPYGATESLPVCSIGSREVLAETAAKTAKGAGVCVGKPVPGIHLEIIGISDDPIATWSDDLPVPVGEIGEIAVSGPVVTRRYFRRDASTVLAKIDDPANDRFFHRMGDLGYLDEQGRVWFCGRKAHRVITRRGTMFTITCEGVFNVYPRVFRTALVGIPDGLGFQKPVLCVETEGTAAEAERQQILAELRVIAAKHDHTRDIEHILFHDAFPVDIRHNAKIFREKLAVWAARKLS